eukprot:366346-Chlamydomonas_euryale.AAC.11
MASIASDLWKNSPGDQSLDRERDGAGEEGACWNGAQPRGRSRCARVVTPLLTLARPWPSLCASASGCAPGNEACLGGATGARRWARVMVCGREAGHLGSSQRNQTLLARLARAGSMIPAGLQHVPKAQHAGSYQTHTWSPVRSSISIPTRSSTKNPTTRNTLDPTRRNNFSPTRRNTRVIPSATPGTLPDATLSALPDAIPETIPCATPGTLLCATLSALPDATPEIIPSATPGVTSTPFPDYSVAGEPSNCRTGSMAANKQTAHKAVPGALS